MPDLKCGPRRQLTCGFKLLTTEDQDLLRCFYSVPENATFAQTAAILHKRAAALICDEITARLSDLCEECPRRLRLVAQRL